MITRIQIMVREIVVLEIGIPPCRVWWWWWLTTMVVGLESRGCLHVVGVGVWGVGGEGDGGDGGGEGERPDGVRGIVGSMWDAPGMSTL